MGKKGKRKEKLKLELKLGKELIRILHKYGHICVGFFLTPFLTCSRFATVTSTCSRFATVTSIDLQY